MDLLSKDDLIRLVDKNDSPCVSMFMPTFRAGRRVEQNAIRYKNLLRQAEGSVVTHGLRSLQVRALMEPAHRLLEQAPFWNHQADGLALFLSPSTFEYFRLPLAFDELVVTAKRFHLKPLLALLNGDASFYLLAFSKNKVRLYQGTQFNLDELDLRGVPRSLSEAPGYDVHQRQLQFYAGAPARAGRRDARFFGTGDADTDEKEMIQRFFKRLDDGLRDTVGDTRAPLVLAGVDYLFPIYRKASSYPTVMEQGIAGNPDDLTADALRERAWKIVGPYFRQAERQAAERYRELAGNGSARATGKLREIVPAALQGRVEYVFVGVGVQRWGRVETETGHVALHERPEPEDQDLLDFAAIHTFLKGGTVYAVPPHDVPNHRSLAAVLRYA